MFRTSRLEGVTPLATYVQGWRNAADDIVEVTADLTDDEWARDTDCPQWNVHDVLAHLVALEQLAAGLDEADPVGTGREVPPAWTETGVRSRRDRPSRQLRDDLATAVATRAEQLTTLLVDADPHGEPDRVPAGLSWDWDTLLRNRTIDMWVHGQDIRRAVNRQGHMDSVGAAVTIATFAAALPYVLGKKVRPVVGTTVVWQLSGARATTVAVTIEESGRARVLPEPPSNPTLRLGMSTEAFALLGAGRQAASTLKVDVLGPGGLATEVCEAMAVTP